MGPTQFDRGQVTSEPMGLDSSRLGRWGLRVFDQISEGDATRCPERELMCYGKVGTLIRMECPPNENKGLGETCSWVPPKHQKRAQLGR